MGDPLIRPLVIDGLGLQNKLSMGFFGLGLCVALVLTPNRKYIVSKVDGKFRPGLYLWGGGERLDLDDDTVGS